jgi:hypothetical protein
MDTGELNSPTLFFIPTNAYVSFGVDYVLNNCLKSCYFMRGLILRLFLFYGEFTHSHFEVCSLRNRFYALPKGHTMNT